MLADITGAKLGCLTEAANSVGGYLAGAFPQSGGLDAQAMLNDPRKAYLVLHAEPELDCANPVAARAALANADFVAVLSPFRHGLDYASVLLPIAPFTETTGTFVSCEGRVQRFNAVVRPLADTRPAWKVLRVLGSMLDSTASISKPSKRRGRQPALPTTTSHRSFAIMRAPTSRHHTRQ